MSTLPFEHSPMKSFRFALVVLLALSAFPERSEAYLIAQNLDGRRGVANLITSRMTVRVGAQWIDIEEEAEVEVATTSGDARGPWILEGTLDLDPGVAITGCMLWNDDTLLMGKLRGKADAEHIFDSLVPPRDSGWARDPLLVEQTGPNTYGFHLFPFQTSGTRSFRLRYLVPLPAGANELSIRPLMSDALDGTLPAQFRLRLRGQVEGVKVVRGALVWPAEFPSYQLIDLDQETDVRLRWPAGPSGDGTCAIKGRIDSGKWAGEFALFTGAVPDSILRKTALKSETVVLWRWVSPGSFFDVCEDAATGSPEGRCPNAHGMKAIEQAGLIGEIATRSVENAGRIGLVVDQGMDDTTLVFPLTDSTTTDWRNMRLWLSSITPEYLKWRIPVGTPGGSDVATNLEISKNRDRFRADILKVGALYSADSGILRHLLVVTVGPVPVTGEFLEAPDLSSLPSDVSIGSSVLVAPNGGEWKAIDGVPTWIGTPPGYAPWPGVDILGAVQARSGGANVVSWQGIPLPRTRETLAGRLSLRSGEVNLSRDIVVRSNGRGGFNTSLNAHGTTLGDEVTWTLYDEEGELLTTWSETPDWLRVDGDSVMPRLWGKADAPISPVFEDLDYAPLFGFVDRLYSLLATPSDTVGWERQVALRDSGVPYLSWREIFPRQGYKNTGDPTGVVRAIAPKGFRVLFDRSARRIRLNLGEMEARSVEIRDLHGRLVARFALASLEDLLRNGWSVPTNLGRGVLLVSVRTPQGVRSHRVMVD